MDPEHEALLVKVKNEIRELAKKLPHDKYIDLCNEMETFFLEESERTIELMDQQDGMRGEF